MGDHERRQRQVKVLMLDVVRTNHIIRVEFAGTLLGFDDYVSEYIWMSTAQGFADT